MRAKSRPFMKKIPFFSDAWLVNLKMNETSANSTARCKIGSHDRMRTKDRPQPDESYSYTKTCERKRLRNNISSALHVAVSEPAAAQFHPPLPKRRGTAAVIA
jgi:hypothetical protein